MSRGPLEAPDFGALARSYDRLRPPDEHWREVADAIWEEGDLIGRRVLDVGCGTGTLTAELARRGAKVWGLDLSPEMLATARNALPPGVGLKLGSAERLPFRDGWFERAVLRTVVHLVDRRRALPELTRVLVPGGKAVIATFAPEHFDLIWVARVFPSLRELDLARFPDPVVLSAELRAAGFASVSIRRISQTVALSREEALAKLRGRYISTLALLPEAEYRAGLEWAERKLPQRIDSGNEWAIVVATTPR